MATRIRIKRGTESQITGYTGVNFSGELAYATNTGNIFVNDGTAFISIGGGGETPTLQTVTDEGNTTTNSIGIGTSTPSALLEIKSSSTNDFLKLTTTGSSASPVKLIFEKSAAEQGVIEFNRNGDFEIYNTDNDGGVLISGSGSATADMYINRLGNVGIGTTAPTEKLEVVSNNNVGTTKIVSAVSLSGSQRTSLGYNSVMGSHSLSLVSQASDLYLFTTAARSIIFNTNNTEVARITDAGRVGIGTTAPTEKLHITGGGAGNIRLDAGGTYYGTNIQAISGAGLKIGNDDFSGYAFFADDGNVGIGTTVPSEKLDVVGNIRLRGVNNLTIGSTGNGGDFSLSSGIRGYKFANQNGDLLVIKSDGKVGIGTSAPTEKLEVVGYAKASTGFKLGNYGLIYDSSNDVNIKNAAYYHINFHTNNTQRMRITNAGNVGIGTSTPSEKLEVSGKAIIRKSGVATPHGDTDFLVTDSTAALSTAQMQILSGNNASSILYFSDTDAYNVGGIKYEHSDNSMRLQVNSSERVIITSDGNVGVGTTAPSEILQVGNDSVGNNYIQIAKKDNSSAGIKISGSGSGRIGFLRVNQSEDLEIGTENNNDVDIFTDGVSRISIEGDNGPTQGYVGIGTASPSERLHVFGGATAIKIDSVTNEASLKYDNSTTTAVIKLANNDLKTELGGSEVMRILANGNFGIGTTAPAYKLEVNEPTTNNLTVAKFTHQQGSVSSNVIFQNTAGADNTGFNLNFATQASGVGGVLGVIRTNSPTAGATDMFLSSSGGEAMRITSDGKVGIGTTAPQQKLSVEGNIELGTGGYIYGDTTTPYLRLSNAVGAILGYSSAYIALGPSFVYNNGSGEKFRIASATGNVGIGTTAPSSLLHIARTSNGEVLRLQDTSNANQNYVFETEAAGAYYGLNLKNGNTGDTIVNFSANGKLGIKTNNPDKAITINETAANDVQIKIGSHFGVGYSEVGQTRSVIGSTYGNNAAMMSFVLGGYTTASDKMTILGSGNVGIGTIAPNSKVHINGTAMEQLRMETAGGPSSAGDASGRIGDMAYDDNYFYIKTTNGWGRMALDFGY